MTVRATCETCGDLDLTANDLRLRVCVETGQAEYRFGCPQCIKVTVKEIGGPTFDLLRAAGVDCYEWHLPKEMFETHTGPTICDNDIIDFRNALTDPERFTQALETLASI